MSGNLKNSASFSELRNYFLPLSSGGINDSPWRPGRKMPLSQFGYPPAWLSTSLPACSDQELELGLEVALLFRVLQRVKVYWEKCKGDKRHKTRGRWESLEGTAADTDSQTAPSQTPKNMCSDVPVSGHHQQPDRLFQSQFFPCWTNPYSYSYWYYN